MRRSRITSLLTVFAVVLALPATAAADDQAVWDAYATSHRGELATAVDAYSRASARIAATSFRKPRWVRAAIRGDRAIARVLGRIGAGVRAQEPSSPGGGEAQRLILASLAAWRRATRVDIAALRAALRGRFGRVARLARRSRSALDRSDELERRARELLRAGDVDLARPKGASFRLARQPLR
jgi:hypothetical protein